jgi:hypothetical protein
MNEKIEKRTKKQQQQQHNTLSSEHETKIFSLFFEFFLSSSYVQFQHKRTHTDKRLSTTTCLSYMKAHCEHEKAFC